MKIITQALAIEDFKSAIQVLLTLMATTRKDDLIFNEKAKVAVLKHNSSIARWSINVGDFKSAIIYSTHCIDYYADIKDKGSIPIDRQLSNLYEQRATAWASLGKMDDCARDLAAAYVEATNDIKRRELIIHCDLLGVIELVKKNIPIYQLLKSRPENEH